MKFYTTFATFSFFLLSFFLHAQDTTKIIKAKRNALKIGVSAIPTKLFLSYEHAFTKHISLGGMASYGGTTFTGYTCNIFTRYYFNRFDNRGWFVEARGSYGHFNPYVYSSYYTRSGTGDETNYYTGKHHANIDYWNAGISSGYKIFLKEYGRSFFEFIAGVHYGKATFGKNDTYMGNGNSPWILAMDYVKDTFVATGPASPFHFMINFGVAF